MTAKKADSAVRAEVGVVLYFVLMAAVIVAVDLLFFASRSWFWERLVVNVGLVLAFAAFYLRFVK